MQPTTENRIVLITRRTRVDDLVSRFNTIQQARFYVEHLGADFSDYQREHDTYRCAVELAEASLSRHGRVHVIDRGFLPNYVFGAKDLVVALGQDGLVANSLKYLDGQPMVGVNPDPARWDGILLPFTVEDLDHLVPQIFDGRRPIRKVTMAKARLNTGLELLAVNDLFIGVKTHTSARYLIRVHGREEAQSSSGLIVSTGLGSSAWFRSLMVGAAAVASLSAGKKVPPPRETRFPWDADYLVFTVREPFPSQTSQASLVFGKVTPSDPLKLVSQTPERGVIFSDGIESDFLEFNAGSEAVVAPSERKGILVV